MLKLQLQLEWKSAGSHRTTSTPWHRSCRKNVYYHSDRPRIFLNYLHWQSDGVVYLCHLPIRSRENLPNSFLNLCRKLPLILPLSCLVTLYQIRSGSDLLSKSLLFINTLSVSLSLSCQTSFLLMKLLNVSNLIFISINFYKQNRGFVSVICIQHYIWVVSIEKFDIKHLKISVFTGSQWQSGSEISLLSKDIGIESHVQ